MELERKEKTMQVKTDDNDSDTLYIHTYGDMTPLACATCRDADKDLTLV